MTIGLFRVSRRSAAVAAVLVASASLAIGAHAAFNKRLEANKPITVSYTADHDAKPVHLALVIGNGHYPDASAPLNQPINDARALSANLRSDGFDVDMIEDAGGSAMRKAVARLKDKITPDSVVMLYFGGYGVQVGRQNYMIPIDAAIWKEADARRDGVSIEQVLEMIKERGAQAKLVVLDASRRNPYERRFRTFSHGLAPIHADNALILSSAVSGKVMDDSDGPNSMLMSELLKNLSNNTDDVATMFAKTRNAVSQQSDGGFVPSLTSSLADNIRIGRSVEASAMRAGS